MWQRADGGSLARVSCDIKSRRPGERIRTQLLLESKDWARSTSVYKTGSCFLGGGVGGRGRRLLGVCLHAHHSQSGGCLRFAQQASWLFWRQLVTSVVGAAQRAAAAAGLMSPISASQARQAWFRGWTSMQPSLCGGASRLGSDLSASRIGVPQHWRAGAASCWWPAALSRSCGSVARQPI
jgi:hypothetical protein